MNERAQRFINDGANLIRYGLSTPEQVRNEMIGYSNPNRDEAMALIEELVAARGHEPLLRFTPILEADRAIALELGAGLLAHGLSTPEAIAANLIDPDTPDRDELLHAICALAKVRKAAFLARY